jgi:hypothetical protein
VRWLSTDLVPGADQAALSASSFSAHERTLPYRLTLLPSTSTLIRRASSSALRRSASSIFVFTSGNAGLGSGTTERGADDAVSGGSRSRRDSLGRATTYLGLGTTLLCGAILLSASIALAIPLSINFAHSLRLDPSPLEGQHGFLSAPKPGDGPVTVTMDFIIRPEDREKFLELAEQIRLIFLRNGAFLFNIDENLEYPGTLRTEMLLSSWAEHLLQLSRMTKPESEIYHSTLAMHAGGETPIVRHYLRAIRRSTPLGFGQFRKRIEASSPNAKQATLARAKTLDEQPNPQTHST